MGICEDTRPPIRVRRHLTKIIIIVGLGVVLLLGLAVVFRNDPPLRNLRKRFMMGR